MTGVEFQKLALRTANSLAKSDLILYGVLGLNGEAGETQVKRGDRIVKPIEWMAEKTGLGHREKEKRLTGTVVYIHPRKRFYILEFHLPHGSFRESYPMEHGGVL